MITCDLCGTELPLTVCKSALGFWYLGYSCNKCGPMERSSKFYLTELGAKRALLKLRNKKAKINQRTIAAAFQRHIDEHHGADFEVCADPECQRAVALEAGIEYPD